MALDPMGINSSVAIALQARAAIWLKDQEGIRKSLVATELVHGRWMASVRGEVKAALAAMEGQPDDAGELYLAAIESWRTLNCVLDIAVTELELIHLLGPEHPQAVTAKEAKDIFTQLGAVP